MVSENGNMVLRRDTGEQIGWARTRAGARRQAKRVLGSGASVYFSPIYCEHRATDRQPRECDQVWYAHLE